MHFLGKKVRRALSSYGKIKMDEKKKRPKNPQKTPKKKNTPTKQKKQPKQKKPKVLPGKESPVVSSDERKQEHP